MNTYTWTMEESMKDRTPATVIFYHWIYDADTIALTRVIGAKDSDLTATGRLVRDAILALAEG